MLGPAALLDTPRTIISLYDDIGGDAPSRFGAPILVTRIDPGWQLRATGDLRCDGGRF